MNSKNYVMFSFIGTTGLIGIYWLKQGKLPAWNVLIGGGVAFTFLALTSEASPDLANAGAILVFVSALMMFGPSVFNFLNGVTNPAPNVSQFPVPAFVNPTTPSYKQFPVPKFVQPTGSKSTSLPSNSYVV